MKKTVVCTAGVLALATIAYIGSHAMHLLINRQLEVKNGDLLLPKQAGLGFEFDEGAVKKYALHPAEPWTEFK